MLLQIRCKPFFLISRVIKLLVLFDKNVPEPLRAFLVGHNVRTIKDMGWHPRIKNGELLKAGEAAAFHVLVTTDQNIKYQQNLKERTIALVVLGSNIWYVVKAHIASILSEVDSSFPGSYMFIEMMLPPKPKWNPPQAKES